MKEKKLYIIAHNIRSLYNVGSIFRTADAFGVSKIYLTGYTGTPEYFAHKNKIAKTALGAEQTVQWEYKKSVKGLINELKKTTPAIKIIALENNVPVGEGLKPSRPLVSFKPRFPLALILGEETKGIPKPLLKLCDEAVEIPMVGQKESLNVSVAFGIAAYALTGKK